MLNFDNETLLQIDVTDEELNQELSAAFGESADDSAIDAAIVETMADLKADTILKGRVVGKSGNEVVVDVGLKSEGYVPLNEWNDESSVDVGDEIEVLLETIESETGILLLSKRKADRIRGWERLLTTCHEGDRVSGKCMRKIKGGLLVDIGVPVFLPASQVDTRRPGDVSQYIGRTVEAVVLKIDEERRNIVISRRKLIEAERAESKAKLLAELEVGEIREGIVKNIADFGAFIDLGGIDGLLHITDMSWDRIGHPSDILRIDDSVKVKILNFDKEREKIALGLKQTQENPWEKVEEKYTVGSKVTGRVVNITPYGSFVKLEKGVEGLVHISEMSWTRRISHPSEILAVDQEIEIVVLDINKDKQEISLGIKQTETNPWMRVAEKYPPNTVVNGRVRNLTNYGAFVEIEEGIDGLLHVSDMSWTKKISHPSELLKKGEEIKCVVLSVDQDKSRIALGLKQLAEDPWLHAVPDRYIPGMIVKGKVTKITNFGVFVELETDLEGLLHVSELSDKHVDDPHKVVEIGEELEVKILRVDTQDRKIGLSKKRADWAANADGEDGGSGKPSTPKQRRGGLHGSSGEETTDIISATVFLDDQTVAEKSTTDESTTDESKTDESKTDQPVIDGSTADKPTTNEAATDDEAGADAAAASEPDAPTTVETLTDSEAPAGDEVPSETETA